jgi:hypothetical protein
VSRRRPKGRAAERGEPGRREPPTRPRGFSSTLGGQLVILAGVFAVAVLVAELAGAANLGVALGVGQIAFAIALVYLLLKR